MWNRFSEEKMFLVCCLPDISAVCFGEKQSFQLAKCFSRAVNKIDRLNTTPKCSSCHLFICRLFFGLSNFFVASPLFMKGISYCVIRRKLEPFIDRVKANFKRS